MIFGSSGSAGEEGHREDNEDRESGGEESEDDVNSGENDDKCCSNQLGTRAMKTSMFQSSLERLVFR